MNLPILVKRSPGQGGLEYLLLIGGAVLIATIVMVMVFGGVFPASGNILNSNLDVYRQHINLGATTGGGEHCGNGVFEPELGEECDASAPSTYCSMACTPDCACTI